MSIPVDVKFDCTCCKIVAPSVQIFYETVGDSCSGCGVTQESDQPPTRTVEDSPYQETECDSYQNWSAYNVGPIEYLKYGYERLTRNYAHIPKEVEGCPPLFPNLSTTYICEYNDSCSECLSNNPPSAPANVPNSCCIFTSTGGGGGPGQDRRVVYIVKDPVTSCNLNDYNYTGVFYEGNLAFTPEDPIANNGSVARHFVSRYGNKQNKKKTRFKIKHEPTISCYLKIWIRKKITVYTIKGNSDTLYEAGEVTYENFGDYVWNGNGNPCFNNTNELADHPDNIVDEDEFREVEVDFIPSEETVEAFEEWNNELNTSTQALESTLGDLTSDSWAGGGNNVPFSEIPPILGGGVVVDLEFKFSITEGYEPSWPNE